MRTWIAIVAYLYLGIAAQAGWIAADWTSSEPNNVYATPGGIGAAHPLGTEQIVVPDTVAALDV